MIALLWIVSTEFSFYPTTFITNAILSTIHYHYVLLLISYDRYTRGMDLLAVVITAGR